MSELGDDNLIASGHLIIHEIDPKSLPDVYVSKHHMARDSPNLAPISLTQNTLSPNFTIIMSTNS